MLAAALDKTPPDFSDILRLSREIADTDANAIRFTTDAGMVRRLGRELVARQETALAELVKNAYDADARNAEVRLVTRSGRGVALVIADDGNGMNRAQLVNGFMRLASDDKIQHPNSPKFGRRRAGRKGIGRFATERLGHRLTLLTTTVESQVTLKVTIDWTGFDSGTDLNTVPNRIEEVPRLPSQGTILTIEGLHDSWSDTQLKRVFRYVATLLQPFGRLSLSNSAEKNDNSSFSVSFRRGDELLDSPQVIADEQSEIIGRALATIHAVIDDEGRATWSLDSSAFGLHLANQEIGLDRENPMPLAYARSARLTAYYYIFTPELLGPGMSTLRLYLSESGGIRLYRNGYRVLPYGERDDDWLSLDAIYAKRGQALAPLANRNFLGIVEIDDKSELFEETSSREGLIEKDAFQELRDLFSAVLVTVVTRIESKRGRGKKKRSEKATQSETRGRDFIEKIENALTNFAKSDISTNTERQSSSRSEAIANDLVLAIQEGQEVARERDDLVEENNLLRILASMGLTVAEFTHDFAALAQTLEIDVDLLSEETSNQPSLLRAARRLKDQFSLAKAYTRYFASMTSHNARRQNKPIDLQAFAEDFCESLRAMFMRNNVELKVLRPPSQDLLTIPMHKSEWSSILLNLLTNSLKAIRRAHSKGVVQIRVGSLGADEVFLDFADNGDGIPEANRERIFEPFFTTSAAPGRSAADQVYALGTGLGLKIVTDIVSAVGGTIDVITPPEGFVTCFRIVVGRYNGDFEDE